MLHLRFLQGSPRVEKILQYTDNKENPLVCIHLINQRFLYQLYQSTIGRFKNKLGLKAR